MFDMDYYKQMQLAEEGDLDAMYNVASYIIWGDRNSPIDPEEAELAVRYYEANAEYGDTDSMLDLGAIYLEGRGVQKDDKTALEWYEKAAELNGRRACRCIANYYRYDVLDDGTPVPTADPDRLRKALEWYQTGTERMEENCIYELGDYYRKGIIVGKAEEKAFALYRQAYEICRELEKERYVVNDSYSDVCFRLAECYHYGIGTEKDLKQAGFFARIARDETKKRLDDGDMYGGYLYPGAMKEWQSIMTEMESGS